MSLTPEEIAERHKELCGLVAEGKTIRQIAEQYGVSAGSIIAWLTDTPERTEQYARARDAAADLFEADIIEAAMAVSPESAPADRVKIDALKWVAARRAPKRYSERLQQQVDLTSSDGSMSPAASQEAVIAALARKHQ